MHPYKLSSGNPSRLGAHHDGAGVNFAVFSENASQIDLCLFSPDGAEEVAQIPLPERTGAVWHGYLAQLPIGTLYGYRAHGPFAPEQGHRFNRHKLLLDPYTREVSGTWQNDPATLGYHASASEEDLSFDTKDSAGFVPKSVVSDPALFAGMAPGHHRPAARDLIYEAHPKGATMQHAQIPLPLRGTYEGMADVAMLDHLKTLGVKTVELLPVQSFVDDKFLVERGLSNYWGYNSIGFFALEPRYFGPGGVQGFRDMVARFHAADIEVVLDVVYNHTAEGDQRGPTLCYRGLDNASYYRLSADNPRFYVNDTGCGNTLNISHPFVLRMVLDSLRFWVESMGIDGFRFDLATTLAREDHGFDRDGGFMDALRQDPVLSQVQLIAEPWDIGPGGYQLGAFPPPFYEWNDSYRDTLRKFWRGDSHSAQELGARLLGSADKFDHGGRRSTASVNFFAAHDGFTLADTTRYAQRHNDANTENNQDGHHSNFSDNCGVEGDTQDPAVRQMRQQRQRNMLATLFVSQGTPMLLAGDEFGNSQQGNNNAYCQDNEIGWLDWPAADKDLQGFVAHLSAFRQAQPVLRQTRFLHGVARAKDDARDVAWCGFDGKALNWDDPELTQLCLILRNSAEAPDYAQSDDALVIAFNRRGTTGHVNLPPTPKAMHWRRGFDTQHPQQQPAKPEGAKAALAPQSVVAFVLCADAEEGMK